MSVDLLLGTAPGLFHDPGELLLDERAQVGAVFGIGAVLTDLFLLWIVARGLRDLRGRR